MPHTKIVNEWTCPACGTGLEGSQLSAMIGAGRCPFCPLGASRHA